MRWTSLCSAAQMLVISWAGTSYPSPLLNFVYRLQVIRAVERSRFAAELSVLQFGEVKVHPSGPSSSRNHALGTLMGDNRNAPSLGKTIVVESERPIDVEQHFLANAKLLHRNENT